jgi:hypothetical protein
VYGGWLGEGGCLIILYIVLVQHEQAVELALILYIQSWLTAVLLGIRPDKNTSRLNHIAV